MAWDSSRPVPWRRLLKEAAIFLVIGGVLFAVAFLKKHPKPAATSACHRHGPLRRRSPSCSPSSATSASRSKQNRQRARWRLARPARRRPRRRRWLGRSRRRRSAPAPARRNRPKSEEALTRARCAPASSPSTPAPPGVRSRAIFPGDPAATVSSYREFTQHFPQPGWVEHDADGDLGRRSCATLDERRRAGRRVESVAAIGITNQRETVVAWRPLDRRAVRHGDRLAGPPHRRPLRGAARRRAPAAGPPDHRAGARSVLLRHEVRVAAGQPRRSRSTTTWRSARSTAWLIWNLTGGEVHATDPSNASRTMLFDIARAARGRRSCARCSACRSTRCPTVLPVERPLRHHLRHASASPAGIPITGVAGDQQAALFGQACFAAGDGQEHLRHRQLRAAQRRSDVPAADRGAAHHGRLDARRRHGRLRARGCDLRHRRGGPVAARRAADHRLGGRDRGAGRTASTDNGGVYVVPGLHRPRQPVVGSLRRGARSSASPAARTEATSPAP